MSALLFHKRLMSRALNLARKGRYTTDPNPNVGCVIVKDGTVIAEGWHGYAGSPHAEINALEQAGQKANGAMMYVSLEPCCHTGRTGPCVDAIISAGIKTVVTAMADPNPAVSGSGHKKLEEAGITVLTSIQEQDARALNEGFILRMEKKRPLIRIKMATSLDGRTAMENGESQWITESQARLDVQKLRAVSSAIVSSARTVLQDDAVLNVRPKEWLESYSETNVVRQPLRIILDSECRLTGKESLFSSTGNIVLVSATNTNASYPELIMSNTAVECITINKDFRGLDLQQLLSSLEKFEINSLLVEAGPTLAGQWIEQGLFDEIHLYVAPVLMGSKGMPAFVLENINDMKDKIPLAVLKQRYVGKDLKIILAKENIH